MFATSLFALVLAQTPINGCAGADPAIISAGVQGVSHQRGTNIYHVKVGVANLGRMRQASNVLQFIDVYLDDNKIDARGVPPLAPGQRFGTVFDYKRSSDAGDGSSTLRFQLRFRQPSPPGAQDCNPGNDTHSLTL